MGSSIPDRYRAFEERQGLVAAGVKTMKDARWAITASIPTMDHACRLFDLVAERLGEGAWLDPEGGPYRRSLLVRDCEHPEWLVPHALLQHRWIEGKTEVVGGTIQFTDSDPLLPADAPEGWKPGDPYWGETFRAPDLQPRGPNMRGGDLCFREGPAYWTQAFRDDGQRHGGEQSAVDQYTMARYQGVKPYMIDPTARPPTPRPVSLLCRADLDKYGHPLDDFARMVTEMDPASRVAARVRLPVPLPFGAQAAWIRALPSLRRALWDGEVPADARWLVADGFEGSAVGWGATREEALARWEAEVARAEPWPPGMREVTPLRPAPPVEPTEPAGWTKTESPDGKSAVLSSGVMSISFKHVGADLDWPPPGLATTPAALVPLPPLPTEILPALAAIGFTRWARVLGEYGQIAHVLVRDDASGFTAIGEGMLDLVDAATLDAEIARVEAEERAFHEGLPGDFPNPWTDPTYTFRLFNFRLWDDVRQRPMPLARSSMQMGGGFSPSGLDGDALRWAVTHMTKV